MRRAAALIVGGGPAGSAAAIGLARAGRRPLVVERSEGPHDVVCGGFLGWDALAALARLGVDAAALGARPIARVRFVSERRSVEAPLPKQAAGLSRRTLDEALLTAAQAAGAEILRGRTAKNADPDTLTVRLDDGETIAAEAFLLATGKHELRGAARSVDLAGRPVGLRTALLPSPALRHTLDQVIELHLFDGGYAGLLVQEDDMVNLCLSASQRRLKAAGGIEALIAELAADLPGLRARLADGGRPDWLAVSGVPYGWRALATAAGLFRLGDQAAVIASLAGDGIAIALESGIAAAHAVTSGEDAPSFQRKLARRTRTPVAVADALRWSAEHSGARRALMAVLGRAPGLAGLGARLTRVGR